MVQVLPIQFITPLCESEKAMNNNGKGTGAPGNSEKPSEVYVKFLENMGQIDSAIRQSDNAEMMMREVLKITLDVFRSDCAWLLCPSELTTDDADTVKWIIRSSQARGNYKNPGNKGVEILLNPNGDILLQDVIAAENPIGFGAGNENSLGGFFTAEHGIKSQLLCAIHLRKGQHWLLGLHQCSDDRVWQSSEKDLLLEIARRLGDGLGLMLFVEDLRQSEERFRTLFDTLKQGVVYQNSLGEITSANSAAERILGLTLDQMQGRLTNDSRWQAIHEDGTDFPGETHPAMEALKTGKPVTNVIMGVFHPLKNEHCWLSIDAIPKFVQGQKHPHEVISSFTDITQIKNAKLELELSNRMIQQERSMFISGPVVVFKWKNAENWPVEYVSPNVEDVLGFSDQEFISGDIVYSSIIRPEDLERVGEEVVSNSVNGAQNFSHLPYRIVRKDGSAIWVDDYTTIVRDKNDEITHYMGYLVDITKRVNAEEHRLNLERQLQHAQKLESLGVLAGGIAHDFNNLLMVILGNTDLALHELSPFSPARQSLLEVEKASTRAADLAKQMLAYSGKGRFVIEPISAADLFREMAHLLEVAIAKNVVLKYDFAEDLPTFEGDATQIRQIVMNLITNASEAIGDRSGMVSLSTGYMDCDRAYLDGLINSNGLLYDEPLPEGGYVYFEVSDNGLGMAQSVIDKIFDPFFTTKFSGRGLGMSAVLGIVRGHNGAINIYSEVGKGTSFKVLFPVGNKQGEVITKKMVNGDSEEWRGRGTVLFVDDEETVLLVGQRMLESLGFSVLTAADGRLALEVYQEHMDEIDCVLLDLTMPHLDGEATFRQIRLLNANAKVILCSGYNEIEATTHFAGKGLVGFIQKPFNLKSLKETFSRIMTQIFPDK